jgi:site-specific DNA recombinase
MTKPVVRRCAVYTRKSSEEGLDQSFNSLQAQREACEAFIKSQAGEGWMLVPAHYDDGGISGATMQRPALQKLLADISSGRVDVVVVYKVDRLTRSLADFAKMVELFDARGVSFVAVTQQFNTTTSMGRLTLNVLLSFAQFEREVTGERIRDKIAASKRKGMWMGGQVPLGYNVVDRALIVNPDEAKLVRNIYARYLALKNVRLVKRELDSQGVKAKPRTHKGSTRGGGPMSPGAIYTVLRNPLYVGDIKHKKVTHPGLHEAIVSRKTWDATQQQLLASRARPRGTARVTEPSPLLGKLFDESGKALTPAHSSRGTQRTRYYISRCLRTGEGSRERAWRLPAHVIENAVASILLQALIDKPALLKNGARVAISEVMAVATTATGQLGNDGSRADALRTLVDRVNLATDSVEVQFGLTVGGHRMQLTRHHKLQLKRRGIELKMILDGNPVEQPIADPALARALARGHRWLSELLMGRATSITDISRREQVSDRYVSRLVRLAFISPEVTEAILAGAHSPVLTLQRIVTAKLALPWAAQRRMLELS